MFLKGDIFFIIVETPLHAGAGTEVGVVDLPIQREKTTDFPKIESSTLKGAIREAFLKLKGSNSPLNKVKEKFNCINEGNWEKCIDLIFGPWENPDHASAVAFTEARILFFPVKSLKGIFAWITCPYVLERFKKDLKVIKGNCPDKLNKDWNLLRNTVSTECDLMVEDNKIILEEFTLNVNKNDDVKSLSEFFSEQIFPNTAYQYIREKMKKDIIIIDKEEFKHFVKESTEIITRIKVSPEKGTVEEGPWYEEYLPENTILYSIALYSPLMISKKKEEEKEKEEKFECLRESEPGKEVENIEKFIKQGMPEILQIGGNQTIGKGIVRIEWFKEGGK